MPTPRRRSAAPRPSRSRDRQLRLVGGEPLEARVMMSAAADRALAGVPPHEAPLFGDVNGDGRVNRQDVGAIRSSLRRPSDQPGFRDGADLNGDGRITPLDLRLARKNLGATRQTAGVFQVPGAAGQPVSLSFTLTARDTIYRNDVGFFRVDDAGGRIGNLYPGDPGYAAVALSGSRHQALFARDREAGAVTRVELPGGSYFATYLIQNSTIGQLLARNPGNRSSRGPRAFFSIQAANPDRYAHMRKSAPGVVAMEDLWRGGDRDHNDAVVQVVVTPHSTPGEPRPQPPIDGPDTRPPVVTISTPSPGVLTRTDVLVYGIARDDRTAIRTLLARIDAGPAFDVAVDPTGQFRFDTNLPRDGSADGVHTVFLRATDDAGNVGESTVSFTLDATLPKVSFGLDPASDTAPVGDDRTELEVVTLRGQTEPGLRVELVGSGRTTLADGQGGFAFGAVVLANLGPTEFVVRATDAAGNVGEARRTITRVETGSCGFEEGLDGWNVVQTGGSGVGVGTVALSGERAVLREGNSFRVALEHTFVIPVSPTTISFEYADLTFDTADPSFINDAFEAALVGDNGVSLVETIGAGRDAFFNITEGLNVAAGPDVTVAGATITVDISDQIPGSSARLILRLVNNDADTMTSVAIACAKVPEEADTDDAPGTGPPDAGTTTPLALQPFAARAAATSTAGGSSADPPASPHEDALAGGPPPQTEAGDSRIDAEARAVFTTSGDFLLGTLTNLNVLDVPDALRLDLASNRPTGTWTEILDGQQSGKTWAGVAIDAEAPAGTAVQARVRAADDREALASLPWVVLDADGRADGVRGRFLQVEVGLRSLGEGTSTDIVFVVDESISMAGEQQWLGPMVAALDARLEAYGLVDNRYGLVGFADTARSLPNSSARFLTAEAFAAATSSLSTGRSGYEDGYSGIKYAMEQYEFRAEASRFVVLVTDERRTVVDRSLGYDAIAELLITRDVGLHGVLNAVVADGQEALALGVDAMGIAFLADGAGGYAESAGGRFVRSEPVGNGDVSDIKSEYVDLTWLVGGVSWDLNRLRGGGDAAVSFTTAFVDRLPLEVGGTPEVRAIVVQAVPGPTVEVIAPAAVAIAAGETVVLSGLATAAQPALPTGVRARNAITHVTVNGKPVDVLDAAGRFFMRVPILAGDNRLVVAATDLYGQTATTTLTIEGTQRPVGEVDFSLFADITASFAAEYARTSFNEDDGTLYADVAVRNVGQYPVDAPLFVAIANISDPTVLPIDAAGYTPDGLPYYDFTGLVPEGTLSPEGLTSTLSFPFWDPNEVRFTYDLIFFGLLNRAPEITSVPRIEAILGRTYSHDVEALDRDGDPVTFRLLSGPEGMAVDPATGVVSWSPTADQLGAHPVTVRADDGRGGLAEQTFHVLAVEAPPNRPPVFTSLPNVEANVGGAYLYLATAADPDFDTLSFTLVAGPAGLAVDPASGRVTWVPTAGQLGDHEVVVRVSDGRGSLAEQRYEVCVMPDPDNRAPVIVSTPRTSLGVTGGLAEPYAYQAYAVDGDGDELTYSLSAAPDGMTIDPATGLIAWQPPADVVAIGFTLRDEAFDPAFWQTSVLRNASGSSGSAATIQAGANGGARRITTNVGGAGSTRGNLVFNVQRRVGRSYDPRQQGAIRTLNWLADARHAGGAAPVMGLVVFQGEKVYATVGRSIEYSSAWQRFEATNLTAEDFFLSDPDQPTLFDQTQHPDFSEAGLPLEFGFLHRIANAANSAAFSAVADVDNWQVEIAASPAFAVTVRVEDGRGGADEQAFPITAFLGGRLNGTVFRDLSGDGAWQFGPQVYIANGGSGGTEILRFDRDGGGLLGRFVYDEAVFSTYSDLVLHPSGDLFVIDYYRNRITRLDGTTGEIIGTFAEGPELAVPSDGVFGPDGDLYVASQGRNAVLRLDGQTGAIVGVIGEGSGMRTPNSLGFTSDGDLYVYAAVSRAIYRFDGATGDLKEVRSGLNAALGHTMVVGPDDALYLSRFLEGDIQQYSTKPMTFTRVLVPPSGDGLDQPYNLTFGGNGVLYATSIGTDAVHAYDPTDGRLIRIFAAAELASPVAVAATTFDPARPIEPTLAGWRVYLDLNENGRRDEDEPSALTGPTGQFTLENVPPGRYGLAIEVQPGWFVSGLGSGRHEVEVGPAESLFGLDFGLFETTDATASASPAFRSDPIEVAVVGEQYRYAPQVLAPSGAILQFDLPAAPEGLAVDSRTGLLVWTPIAGQVGEQAVILRMRDDRDGVALQSFTVTVAAANTAPVVTSTPPAGPATAVLPFRYQVTAQDADGDPLAFRLASGPAGLAIDAATGRIDWTPLAGQVGEHDVVVEVEDGRGGLASHGFRLTVEADSPNVAPLIVSRPRTQAWLGRIYADLVVAEDANGDPLTYRLVRGPEGMTINTAEGLDGRAVVTPGLLRWEPADSQFGTHEVEVLVEDGRGGTATQMFSVEVTAQMANRAPRITSNPRANATIGRPFVLDLTAIDPDGDPLSWSLVAGPHGMSIDPAFGTLRWLPTGHQDAPVEVVVQVQDPFLAGSSQSFTLIVSCVNQAPQITSRPPTEAFANDPYVYAVRADDPENDHLAFSLLAFPSGMRIEADTGLIRWVPTAGQAGQAGTAAVAIQVDDGQGNVATQTFTIVTTAQPRNRAPVITSRPQIGATAGGPYTYEVRATDPEGEVLRFELGTHPDGMTIDPATGILSWTPSESDLGSHIITVAAIDPLGAHGTQSYLIWVVRNQAPVITSTPILTVAAGGAYRYDVRATDPNDDPLTYTLASAPSGMSIDRFGRITWDVAIDGVGSLPVTVVVTDPQGLEAVQTYEVTIRPDTVAPHVQVVASATIVDLGVEIRYQVLASDNVRVETLMLIVNGVPLALDGNGGATRLMDRAGTITAVATATDPAGNVGSASVDVQVRDPNDTAGPYVQLAHTEDRYAWAVLEYFDAGAGPHGIKGGEFGVPLSPDVVLGKPAPGPFRATNPDLDALSLSAGSFIIVRFEDDAVSDGAGQDLFVQSVSDGGNESADVYVSADGVNFVYLNRITWTRGVGGGDPTGKAGLDLADIGFTEPVRAVKIVGLDNGGDSAGFEVVAVRGLTRAARETVTYLTDIIGTVRDDSLSSWRLEYARADEVNRYTISSYHPAWQTLATGTTNVEHDALGVFDPTLLSNDQYIVRLTAEDSNGNVGITSAVLNIQGNAKLGNFRLDFTDLSIPLAGIPITVTRTYDTLQANTEGAFGYGWSLGLASGDIRETVPQIGDGFFATGAPFREGTRVFITNPEGRRVGFTFTPVSGINIFLGVTYTPKFTPDPGVTDTLTVSPISLAKGTDGIFGAVLFGFPYNPDAYTLTTKEGVRYDYDQRAGLRKVTDRNGNSLEIRNDGIFSSAGPSIQFKRDNRGRIKEIVDPAGNSLIYRYDAAGNLISFADQAGSTTTYGYKADRAHFLETITDPMGRQVLKAEFDADGRLIGTTDALGASVRQNLDPDSFTGTITDANGNVTELVYNVYGDILSQKDPEGGITRYEYSDPANPDKETKVIDPRGFATTSTYDVRGNVLSVTDALGKTRLMTYDAGNRLLSATDELGRTTMNLYDAKGNVVRAVDPAGVARTAARDDLGRIMTVTDGLGNATELDYTDGCGCGSPKRVINPDRSVREFEYNWLGQVTKFIDEEGHVTTYAYEARGLLLSTNDANGQMVSFEYDAAGNRTLVRDPLGNETRFHYDAAGRVVEETDPLGFKTKYAYDPAGNLVEEIDRNGRIIRYAHDRNNRPTEVTWYTTDEILIRTIVTTYDAAGNRLSASDPDSTLSFTYDALGRVQTTSNAGTPGVPAIVLTYSYDAAGNVVAVYDNQGVRVESAYDSRDLLVERTWQGAELDAVRIEFGYDANGQRKSIDRYADLAGTRRSVSTATRYNNRGLIEAITHTNAFDGALADFEYEYDRLGLVRSFRDDGQVVDYEYDAISQIISADYADNALQPDERYVYDANGNRVESHRHGAGYVTGPGNQLLSDGTFDYDYDPEGNLARKFEIATGTVTSYEYDHNNRLFRVMERSAGGIIQNESRHIYDVDGRRIALVTDGASIQTIYNGEDVWSDTDSNGHVVARYLYGDTMDQLLARGRTGEGIVWYLGDRLGTVRELADELGSPLNSVDYDSFGNVLSATDSDYADRFAFTGREFDESIGLYYYRARHFDPTVGTFTGRDPLGFDSGDHNQTRYASNSPTNFTDPTGMIALPSAAFFGKLIKRVPVENIHATVLSTSGKVTIRTGGTIRPAKVGDILKQGDQIRTYVKSTAKLKFSNGHTIKMSEKTTITLCTYGGLFPCIPIIPSIGGIRG